MRLIPETELRAIAESGSPMRREAAERELALREAHRAALSGGSAAGCP